MLTLPILTGQCLQGLALGLGIGGAIGLVAILAVAIIVVRTRTNELRYVHAAANDEQEEDRV